MNNLDQIIVLNDVAVDGASTPQLVDAHVNVGLEVAMTGFTGTVKFVMSNLLAKPDFGASASKTNPWTYVKCVDLIDGSAVNGGTGLTGSSTTSVTNLEVNTNNVRWIGAIVSSRSAGSIQVKVKANSNA
jgi:hypothetical protein